MKIAVKICPFMPFVVYIALLYEFLFFMVCYGFFNEKYTNGACNEQDTCQYKHVYLMASHQM